MGEAKELAIRLAVALLELESVYRDRDPALVVRDGAAALVLSDDGARQRVAKAYQAACREHGRAHQDWRAMRHRHEHPPKGETPTDPGGEPARPSVHLDAESALIACSHALLELPDLRRDRRLVAQRVRQHAGTVTGVPTAAVVGLVKAVWWWVCEEEGIAAVGGGEGVGSGGVETE